MVECKDIKCPGYFAEFLGTAILIMIGVGTAVLSGLSIGYMGIGFAFGLTLMALVYVFGPVSGCHLNPGVTLTMLLTKQMDAKVALGFIISQLLGGILGAYIVYMIAMGKADFSLINGFASNGYGIHSPGGYTLGSVLLAEVVLTAIFLLVILAINHYQFRKQQMFSGIAIGGTLAVIHFVALPVSGASFNFARSLATAVVEGGWALEQLWIFALAQVIAAIIATMLYRFLVYLYDRRYVLKKDCYHSCCCVDCKCVDCKCPCHCEKSIVMEKKDVMEEQTY